MRTCANTAEEIGIREAVVNALAEAGLADDAQGRMLLLQTIRDGLDRPLVIPNHAVGRDHLIELVNACARTEEGMTALVQAVWVMRPRSPEYERVRQLVEDPHVLDLLPETEQDRLHEWLAGITVPRLPALVRRATGPGMAPPRPEASAWEAFCYLADFNAGADGFPPCLFLVELIARHVGGTLQAELTGWNDIQARRLRLEPELRARRASGVTELGIDSWLHLMIVVQPDGIDSDRYWLSHWRQDDPEDWPPARGDTCSVTLDDLERRVDDTVVDAERAWAGHEGTAALEFVLPRTLLNLPVHLWHKEHDSGDPRPLCLSYPIVVRSLERMRSPHWHRAWRQRWQALITDPSGKKVHFGQPSDTEERYRLDALLNDPDWVSMVLSTAPAPEPKPGADELTAALRSGLPAVLWHRAGGSSDVLRDIVAWLLEGTGLTGLPTRMHDARRSAFLASSMPFDGSLARDLVVMWDDPRRVVLLDQPLSRPRHKGDTADER